MPTGVSVVVAGHPDLSLVDQAGEVLQRKRDVERLVDEADAGETAAREILDVLDAVPLIRRARRRW